MIPVNNRLKIFSFGALSTVLTLGFYQSVEAQITVSTSSTSSWVGSPVYETGGAPTTGSGGTSQDNDSWGGNANGTAGFGALAQAFEVTSSGTLSTAQLVMAGAPATFNVELYNLGTAPANFPSATVGGAPTITQLNNVGGAGSPNLLASGDQFAFAGTGSTTLATLTFGGADANVELDPGNVYVLSLDPTANADGTWWVRGGVPVAGYNTGEGFNADGVAGLQNFEGKSSIRDFDLGMTTVPLPEPNTFALMGVGSLAWGFVRRFKK